MRALFYNALLPAALAFAGVAACGLLGDKGILALIAALIAALTGVAIWKRPDFALLAAFAH